MKVNSSNVNSTADMVPLPAQIGRSLRDRHLREVLRHLPLDEHELYHGRPRNVSGPTPVQTNTPFCGRVMQLEHRWLVEGVATETAP